MVHLFIFTRHEKAKSEKIIKTNDALKSFQRLPLIHQRLISEKDEKPAESLNNERRARLIFV